MDGGFCMISLSPQFFARLKKRTTFLTIFSLLLSGISIAFITATPAQAATLDMNLLPYLKFNHGTINTNYKNFTGTGAANGSVVLFKGVAPGASTAIDCVVTTTLVNGGTISDYDDQSKAIASITPSANDTSTAYLLMQTVSSASSAAASGTNLTFDFYLANTYVGAKTGTPVVLTNVKINTVDLDNNAGEFQYTDFSGYQSYKLTTTASKVSPSYQAGTPKFTRFITTETAGQNNIPQDQVTVTYNSLSSITIGLGSTTGLGKSSQFGILFGPGSWGNTATTDWPANPTYNSPPTSTADSTNVAASSTTVLTSSDFGTYADLDNNPFTNVKITTLPTSGTLQYLAGASWLSVAAGQIIPVSLIDLSGLRYVAPASAASAIPIIFGVGDGQTYSASNYTLSVSLTNSAQTINFANPGARALAAGVFASNAVSVVTGTSTPTGLTVTLTSLSTGTCTVSGLNITPVANGGCQIDATQAGNATYGAAAHVQRDFQVYTGVAQVIDFPTPATSYHSAGQTLTIASGATSKTTAGALTGLTVTLSSLTPLVCVINESNPLNIDLAGDFGQCQIRASQIGGTVSGTTYEQATDVIPYFTVSPPTHTVTYALASGTSTLPTQADVEEGTGFTLAAAATRDFYTFAGWKDGVTTYAANASYVMSTSNVTLTAQWTAVAATPSVSVPTSVSLNTGATATFTVTATVTDSGALTYQWKVLTTAAGATWANVTTGSGGTTNSYTTAALTSADTGNQYQVIVTNTKNGAVASTTSSAATATVGGIAIANTTMTKTLEANVTTAISGVSVSGLIAGSTYQVSITLSPVPTGVTLQIANTTGVTAAYGYTAPPNTFASFTTITFTGLVADINTALASLRYVSSGAAAYSGTPIITFTAVPYTAGVAYGQFNNHYYQSVGTTMTYAAARDYAKTQTLFGQTGYVVTITSDLEDAFVNRTISGASNIWIGATDALVENTWKWDTSGGSPEAGTTFYTGRSNSSPNWLNTVAGVNTNRWCSGEPNNYGSGENFAVTNWSGGSCWNDYGLPATAASLGFVIEYGTNASGNGFVSGLSATTTMSITQNAAPIISGGSNITTTFGFAANSTAFTATGFYTPLVFSIAKVTAGSYSGITINSSTGVVSASSSTLAGSYDMRVTVTDANTSNASATLTVLVNARPTISGGSDITTTYQVAATSTAFSSSGGTGTITFSIANTSGGGSTAGITINSSTGVVSASSSTVAGSYGMTITATDTKGATATATMTVLVNARPTISGGSDITTTSGVAKTSTAFSAALGTPTLTFSIAKTSDSQAVAGITINSSTGVVSSSISTAAGTYGMSVTVTDAKGVTATATMTVTVNSAITISGGSDITTTYQVAATSTAFSASGGTPTLTFSIAKVTAGSYTGITINSSTGVVSASSSTLAGSYDMRVTVTDANTSNASATLTVLVNARPAISGGSNIATPTGTEASSTAFSASGGTGTITFSIAQTSDSQAVIGISIGSTSGVVTTSVSTSAGSYTMTVTATDTKGATATTTMTVTSGVQAPLSITSITGTFGRKLTLITSGGSTGGAVTYVVSGSNNNAGCTTDGGYLSATSAGSCKVTATMAGNAIYNPVSSDLTTITFSTTSSTVIIVLSPTVVYQESISITATVGTPGKVTFKQNDRVISGCSGISTTKTGTFTATCIWRPSTLGAANVVAILNPTLTSLPEVTSEAKWSIVEQRR